MDSDEPVELTAAEMLLNDVVEYLKRFVVCDEDQYLVLAHYVIHTWLFEVAHCTPYLYVSSKKAESGKTRLLDALERVCRSAIRADDMTAPIMFKIIERYGAPTLLIDEVDTIFAGGRNDAKKRILDTGYKEGGTAWREQAREPIEFSTFSPKVLCGIKNGFLPAPLQGRCIPISMQRKDTATMVERFNPYYVQRDPRVLKLNEDLKAFAERSKIDVAVQFPEPIPALGDRQNEICEALLSIAAVIGTDMELREALTKLFGKVTKPSSILSELLKRIKAAFGDEDRMHTEDLCRVLDPTGRAYNGRTLAMWLEPVGVKPKDIRIGDVKKGYYLADFEPAFAMYLDDDRAHLRLVEDDEEAAA